MRSLRGWYLTVIVVSLTAAASQVHGQSHAGFAPAPQQMGSSGAPYLNPALPPQAAQAAFSPGSQPYPGWMQAQPNPGAAASYAPAANMSVPPGMQLAAYQDAPSAYAAPQPFPGSQLTPGGSVMSHSDGSVAGYGGAGIGCDSCGGYECGPGAGGACAYCGGHGCEYCDGLLGGALGRVFGAVAPYTEGGRCAPRWFDIAVDGMYMTREEVSRRVDIASQGINGDIVLSTDDLDVDFEPGFRLDAKLQVWAGSHLEFTYFGLFNWTAGQTVAQDEGDLFSVFSDFGSEPFEGFDETDFSAFQSINYSSTIDNFELSWAKTWIGPNCRVQGSWLAGVRYIYLEEDFGYDTMGGDDLRTEGVIETAGSSSTLVNTTNSLTGFQFGGDIWSAIVPGVNLGAGLKAGVYGNHANQRNTTVATTTNPELTTTFAQSDDIGDVAFVGEANLQLLYRISPHWTLRSGYNFLYLDGLALAPENLNTDPPPNLQRAPDERAVRSNDNGDAFFHGGNAGLEYLW